MKHLFIKVLLASGISFLGSANASELAGEADVAALPLARPSSPVPAADPYLNSVLRGEVHAAVSAVNNLLTGIRPAYNLNDRSGWAGYVHAAVRHVYEAENMGVWQPLVSVLPAIKPFSLAELGRMFERLQMGDSQGTPVFYCVEGVDAKALSRSPYAVNAVSQIASQFNFLESVSSDYAAIPDYLWDRTQGPQGSLDVLSALIIRDFMFKNPEAQVAIQPLFEGLHERVYRGGYLMPTSIPVPEEAAFIRGLEAGLGTLNILAQWGHPEFGAHPLLQVFTAAPSFQGEWRPPAPGSFGAQVCELLVPPQYAAIAQLAVAMSWRQQRRVSVHYTLVGQGAFNNPETVMTNAFRAIADTVRRCPINVFFHGYKPSDVAMIKRNLPKGLEVQDMNAPTFFAGGLPGAGPAAAPTVSTDSSAGTEGTP